MLENIMDAMQPIVTTIVQDLITFIVLGLLIGYGLLKTKILSFIKNEMLHRIASEGFAIAETNFKELGSNGKYDEAFKYTSNKLGQFHIKVSEDEIKAAIERACLEYNTKKKVVIEKNKAS
ncbi:phage holin, LLH family [Paenibacillus sp. DMB20]|uniref:phage holin, LLH family n=1 Tax=Paenibacillus sp. DMB20 TaxID=1642570 RepID=UPI000627FA78|nr:phage holin, LLH family [Paenibacillus sp. DMB20]KKO51164.1 hypothetical protein XI25_29715 [Paenibacillus sp. DMB20]